jgi:hypothetical protein
VGTGIRRTPKSAATRGEDDPTTSQPKPASITPTLNATVPSRRLKHRSRPMRGLRADQTAHVIIAGYDFIQNIRRGHYKLAVDAPPILRVAAAFTELAQAI